MRHKGLNKYSKSYLNHLIKSDEILASMLISLNNINFYQQFMRKLDRISKTVVLMYFTKNTLIFLINYLKFS